MITSRQLSIASYLIYFRSIIFFVCLPQGAKFRKKFSYYQMNIFSKCYFVSSTYLDTKENSIFLCSLQKNFQNFFFLFELILQSLPYKLSFGDMFQFFTHCEEPWHGVFVIKKKSGENFWHISFSYHFPYYVFRII